MPRAAPPWRQGLVIGAGSVLAFLLGGALWLLVLGLLQALTARGDDIFSATFDRGAVASFYARAFVVGTALAWGCAVVSVRRTGGRHLGARVGSVVAWNFLVPVIAAVAAMLWIAGSKIEATAFIELMAVYPFTAAFGWALSGAPVAAALLAARVFEHDASTASSMQPRVLGQDELDEDAEIEAAPGAA